MASRTDDLESRVQALTEVTNHLHNRLAHVEGRMDGKKETATLLISAFLSGLGVLVSALMGLLNLQDRL